MVDRDGTRPRAGANSEPTGSKPEAKQETTSKRHPPTKSRSGRKPKPKTNVTHPATAKDPKPKRKEPSQNPQRHTDTQQGPTARAEEQSDEGTATKRSGSAATRKTTSGEAGGPKRKEPPPRTHKKKAFRAGPQRQCCTVVIRNGTRPRGAGRRPSSPAGVVVGVADGCSNI